MLFVIHAMDKKDAINVRAKHYKEHRQHLDDSVIAAQRDFDLCGRDFVN